MKRGLFICTGNSCRSQMADGIINHDFAGEIEAFSAGTNPHGLNSKAVQVMAEIDIDISDNTSDHISRYQDQGFDWIISLCEDANNNCPTSFNGKTRIHIPFDDPPRAEGTEEEMLKTHRRVRDQIREQLGAFFHLQLQQTQGNS